MRGREREQKAVISPSWLPLIQKADFPVVERRMGQIMVIRILCGSSWFAFPSFYCFPSRLLEDEIIHFYVCTKGLFLGLRRAMAISEHVWPGFPEWFSGGQGRWLNRIRWPIYRGTWETWEKDHEIFKNFPVCPGANSFDCTLDYQNHLFFPFGSLLNMFCLPRDSSYRKSPQGIRYSSFSYQREVAVFSSINTAKTFQPRPWAFPIHCEVWLATSHWW